MQSSRLLSILLRLQLRQHVSAAALAREFEVSVRTVYRDVDALSAAGVPLHTQRGRGGGIVLDPGWRKPLAGLDGLTAPEARSVPLAGLRGAARDLGLGAEAADVQLRLLASLPPDAAADAARIAECLHVDPLPWYHRPEPLPLLPALAAAVWRGRRVRVRYAGWDGEAEHTLAPLGLVLKGGLWYLVASAVGRGRARTNPSSPRTYRASGITTLRELALPAQRPAGFVLAAHWPQAVADFEARLMAGRATVRLTEEGLRILRAVQPAAAEWARRTQRQADRAGWIEAELPIEPEPYAARQLLRLGTEVEVLSPASLRAAVAAEAAAVARQHRQCRCPEAP